MVNEHGLRSASLSTTDVNRTEVPVAAVVALVVEVSHDGPHPREADSAWQQRVWGRPAEEELLRAGNKDEKII